MTIAIDRDYRKRGPAPLYWQYDRQHEPQPAYLTLDEDGTVRVDYSGELGNARPITVHLGRTIRWRVPSNMSVDGIDKLLDELQPLLERVHAGHNLFAYEGDRRGALTDDAQAASDEIERNIEGIDEDSLAPIADACDWASYGWNMIVVEYRAACSRRRYIQSLIDLANEDGIVLVNVDKLERRLDEAIAELEETE